MCLLPRTPPPRFVCLSVWQATAAQTMGGKFIACLSGISAFVAIGLEHWCGVEGWLLMLAQFPPRAFKGLH